MINSLNKEIPDNQQQKTRTLSNDYGTKNSNKGQNIQILTKKTELDAFRKKLTFDENNTEYENANNNNNQENLIPGNGEGRKMTRFNEKLSFETARKKSKFGPGGVAGENMENEGNVEKKSLKNLLSPSKSILKKKVGASSDNLLSQNSFEDHQIKPVDNNL